MEDKINWSRRSLETETGLITVAQQAVMQIRTREEELAVEFKCVGHHSQLM